MINPASFPLSIVYEVIKRGHNAYIKLNDDAFHRYSNLFRTPWFFELYNYKEPILTQYYLDNKPFNDVTNEKWEYSQAELVTLFNDEIAIYQTLNDGTLNEKLFKLYKKSRIYHILLEYLKKAAEVGTAFETISYSAILDIIYNNTHAVNESFYDTYDAHYAGTTPWLVNNQLVLENLTIPTDYVQEFITSLNGKNIYYDNDYVYYFLFTILLFRNICGFDNRFNDYTQTALVCDTTRDHRSNIHALLEGQGNYSNARADKNVFYVLNYTNDIIYLGDLNKLEHFKACVFNQISRTIDITLDIDNDYHDYLLFIFGMGHKIAIYDANKEYKIFYITHLNEKLKECSIIASELNAFEDLMFPFIVIDTVDTRPYFTSVAGFVNNWPNYFGFRYDPTIQNNHSVADSYLQSLNSYTNFNWGVNSLREFFNYIKNKYLFDYDIKGIIDESGDFNLYITFDWLNDYNVKPKNLFVEVSDYAFVTALEPLSSRLVLDGGIGGSYVIDRWNYNPTPNNQTNDTINRGDGFKLNNDSNTKVAEINRGPPQVVDGNTFGCGDDGWRRNIYNGDGVTINEFNPSNLFINSNVKPYTKRISSSVTVPTYEDPAKYQDEVNKFRNDFKYNEIAEWAKINTEGNNLQELTIENHTDNYFIDQLNINCTIKHVEYVLNNFTYNYNFMTKTLTITLKNVPRYTDLTGDD